MRGYITFILVLLLCHAHACKHDKDILYFWHLKSYHKTHVANCFADEIAAKVSVDKKLVKVKTSSMDLEANDVKTGE